MSETPKRVLFVCVHNAGRSQMAEAFTNHLAGEKGDPVLGLSAGTEAGSRINPLAVEVMAEIGISMEGQAPKRLTQELADSSDRIITMGCGVDATSCPARIHLSEDWGLDDPAGKPIEKVREIRDQIRGRVEAMLSELSVRALRLEVLSHDTLPHHGPGRHPSGEFSLTTIKAQLHPTTMPGEPRGLKMAKAWADNSRGDDSLEHFAIDADDETG